MVECTVWRQKIHVCSRGPHKVKVVKRFPSQPDNDTLDNDVCRAGIMREKEVEIRDSNYPNSVVYSI